MLLNRDTKKFWHGWKSQYGSHGNNETVIARCSSSNDVCEGFLTSFKQNFKNSNDCAHLKEQFMERYDTHIYKQQRQCLIVIL